MPLLGYLSTVTTYKSEVTATVLITKILLIWRVQFMEIGCQGVCKWRKVGNHWSKPKEHFILHETSALELHVLFTKLPYTVWGLRLPQHSVSRISSSVIWHCVVWWVCVLEYQSSSLKMKAAVFYRTWAPTYKTIHHYIWEDILISTYISHFN